VLTSTTPRCPLHGFGMAYTGRECQAPAAATVELPILALAPSSTAGCRSKVVEISTHGSLLVHCSPIFPWVCCTNKLRNPPSGTLLYLHLASSQACPVSITRNAPLSRCAIVGFYRSTVLCAASFRGANSIPSFPATVLWSEGTRMTQVSAL
jgi:hypothetical protein